ncbi:MAG TPA: SAF domain-containing protein [Planktothrix sp.]|jgi:hypothetical protein
MSQLKIPSTLTQRDVLFAAAGAAIASIAVGGWYEFHSTGYSLVCQELQWRLRTLEMAGKVPTVYATKDIPLNTIVTYDAMRTVHNYDEAHLPANAIGDPWIAVGRTARRTIRKGELLDFSDVFPRDELP